MRGSLVQRADIFFWRKDILSLTSAHFQFLHRRTDSRSYTSLNNKPNRGLANDQDSVREYWLESEFLWHSRETAAPSAFEKVLEKR